MIKKFFNPDFVLALAIGGILLVLIFPLPAVVLDMLLVLNISISVLLLLLMFYIANPLDMSSFPAFLLILTLFRLSLNVASTKLILLNGQAGTVINAFGRFVVGNNYVIGTVVFLILVMIQFLVITKGAGRIAEVAARFTLDSMPGKQMSIDADLNAGVIDAPEARERRETISREADFYGAMDGASKFVKGDAIAGLVITGTNIVGGLTIGILQQKMEVAAALQTYTMLTIGDGLVSQIPALIIAIASGILVTKTSAKSNLGHHMSEELFRHYQPMFMCSFMLLVLGVLPGLPLFPFLVLSGGSCLGGMMIKAKQEEKTEDVRTGKNTAPAGQLPGAAESPEPETVTDRALSPMAIEIGFSLVPLVDETRGGELVNRVKAMREQLQSELGVMIPPVSIRDNIKLENNEYRILVRGLERCRDRVYPDSLFAIDPGDVHDPIEGVRVKDPTFGFDAVWINSSRRETAESKGYTVVDASGVVTTHATTVARHNAADLLSRQAVSDIVDRLKESNPAVVDELLPERLSIGGVHRVLQYLLMEMVPIHDLAVILETLSDFAEQSKDPAILSEFCRQAVSASIVSRYISDDGKLYAISLHPKLEEDILNSIDRGVSGGIPSLAPERVAQINRQIKTVYDKLRADRGGDFVMLAAPMVRRQLRSMIERRMPDLAVLSHAEVDENVELRVIAVIKTPSTTDAPSGSGREDESEFAKIARGDMEMSNT